MSRLADAKGFSVDSCRYECCTYWINSPLLIVKLHEQTYVLTSIAFIGKTVPLELKLM